MPDHPRERPTRWKTSVCVLFRSSVRRSSTITQGNLIRFTQTPNCRCIACPALSRLSHDLITSFVYSHDVVSRLSLGSVRDMQRAAAWLCAAQEAPPRDGHESEGYGAVTMRALKHRAGYGDEGDAEWVSSGALRASIALLIASRDPRSSLQFGRRSKRTCIWRTCFRRGTCCGRCAMGICRQVGRRRGKARVPAVRQKR